MQITVGERSLTINNAYAFRYQNGKLVLKIELPQSEITHDELKALLKNNTGDIVKVDDEGNVETYTGFSYTLILIDRDDIYECELECISETERRLRDVQLLVQRQDALIAEQAELIEQTSEVLDFLLMQD